MTPAVLAARSASVPHAIHTYEPDPAHPSWGLEAAEKLGVDPGTVFKTLVLMVDGRPAVAVLPVQSSLDPKAFAAALGGRRAALAASADAERITGYVVGGISPLGQRKRLPTVLDESAAALPRILVSAGRRGLELELAPTDLLRLLSARVARICR